MMSEKTTEQTYVALLQNWIASLRQRFRLSPSWTAAIDRLERRLAERPQSVTALDADRLFRRSKSTGPWPRRRPALTAPRHS